MFCSVIIPVYEREDVLRRCLDCFKAQQFKDFEVILVDDCSPYTYDNYASVIRDYESCFSIIYIKTESNIGPGDAKQMGLEKAKGDYVLFMDADDVISDGLLHKAYNRDTWNVAVITPERKVLFLDADGSLIKEESFKPPEAVRQGSLLRRRFILDNNIYYVPMFSHKEEDSAFFHAVNMALASSKVQCDVIPDESYTHIIVSGRRGASDYYDEQNSALQVILVSVNRFFTSIRFGQPNDDSFSMICYGMAFILNDIHKHGSTVLPDRFLNLKSVMSDYFDYLDKNGIKPVFNDRIVFYESTDYMFLDSVPKHLPGLKAATEQVIRLAGRPKISRPEEVSVVSLEQSVSWRDLDWRAFMITDISNMEKTDHVYGNMVHRDTVVIDGIRYMIKYKNPMQEHIGSCIYNMLGYPAQETMLVSNNGRLGVVCRDFTEGSISFATVSDLIRPGTAVLSERFGIPLYDSVDIDSEPAVPLQSVLLQVHYNDALARIRGFRTRFWDMFVIDLWISNQDRGFTNWGVLDGGPAPVYDNGDSLPCRMPEECDSYDYFISHGATSYCIDNHRLSVRDILKLRVKGMKTALDRNVRRAEEAMPRIMSFIEDLPEEVVDTDMKAFYCKWLPDRLQYIKEHR